MGSGVALGCSGLLWGCSGALWTALERYAPGVLAAPAAAAATAGATAPFNFPRISKRIPFSFLQIKRGFPLNVLWAQAMEYL